MTYACRVGLLAYSLKGEKRKTVSTYKRKSGKGLIKLFPTTAVLHVTAWSTKNTTVSDSSVANPFSDLPVNWLKAKSTLRINFLVLKIVFGFRL